MLNVKLIDGVFKESQEKGQEYLLFLDVDRLIAPCYEAASKEAKKPRYGGWESMEIAGHSIGHWLSAAAAMYRETNDNKLKEKLNYAIAELGRVQSFDEEGYVSGFSRACFDEVFTGEFRVEHFGLGGSWVPWYSIHKIYAGLIDAYQLTGSKEALEIVTKLSDWAYRGLSPLTEEQFQRMLIAEHGGMNDVMANMYLITGEEKYLELAKRFCHQAVLHPLAKEIDNLEGKHANTQIPKLIGAAKLYEITGEKSYRDMVEFFWNEVSHHRSYVIGGNSNREHFGPPDTEELGVLTNETCNTYNMLQLTEHLFNWTKDSSYMDYYERGLYNHILASQDPDSGMKTYFVSTEPGHFKVYCSPEESFWCCTGTGMENPARYTRFIYVQQEQDFYVNLFIASEVTLLDQETIIRQETIFPKSEKSSLVFKEASGQELNVHIRVPNWVTGNVELKLNGEVVNAPVDRGYVTIKKAWAKGDRIEVLLPMSLHVYQAKDDGTKQAFLYGPVVLAGALGTENFPETDILADHLALNNHELIDVPALVTDGSVDQWLHPVEGKPLTFETDAIGQPGHVKVRFIPFYELHHERYSLYWKVATQEEYEKGVDEEKKKQEWIRAITVDEIQPGEQQPEIEHGIQSEHSQTGYLNKVHKSWRDCRDNGFFSYKMAVQPNKPMYLLVTYFGSDNTLHEDGKAYERDFTISIDGTVIANQILKSEKPEDIYLVCYDIPFNLTEGKEKVEVRFDAPEGQVAGGVYGIRMQNESQ